MIDRQTNIPTCVNWKSNWHTPIVHKVFCSINVHILEQCIRKLIPAIPMYLSFMHDGVSRHCQILSSSSICHFQFAHFHASSACWGRWLTSYLCMQYVCKLPRKGRGLVLADQTRKHSAWVKRDLSKVKEVLSILTGVKGICIRLLR